MLLVPLLQIVSQEIMKRVVDILHSEQCSCVVENRGEIHTFFGRGVKDLYTLYTTRPDILHGALIADKVVGRAAAALMIMGGVKQVYADTISELALELFSQTDIKVDFGDRVPHIINRNKTDMCPMERSTQHLNSLDTIIDAIDKFICSLA